MIMPAIEFTPSDTALAVTGDMRAAVRRFIASRVKDAATTEDLTQVVLIKVQRRVAQVRDPRRLMGWVIQIARTTVADYFRSARTTEPFSEQHASSLAMRPESLEREENELRDGLAAYICAVVHALPPIYRDALVATEYDGLSQVELAHHLGLSVSAAKSRVQRARALVRETIERCCHFEVDRYGTVVGCQPRITRCTCEREGAG